MRQRGAARAGAEEGGGGRGGRDGELVEGNLGDRVICGEAAKRRQKTEAVGVLTGERHGVTHSAAEGRWIGVGQVVAAEIVGQDERKEIGLGRSTPRRDDAGKEDDIVDVAEADVSLVGDDD